MTTDLSALIERVEKATGPDRELDEALALAFGWRLREIVLVRTVLEWERPTGFRLPIGTMADPPFFTASLDAALALVERVLPGAQTTLIVTPHGAQAWTGLDDADAGITRHHTPALALILA